MQCRLYTANANASLATLGQERLRGGFSRPTRLHLQSPNGITDLLHNSLGIPLPPVTFPSSFVYVYHDTQETQDDVMKFTHSEEVH